jgi:predicted MFS family arabinose efflux permease
MYGAALVAVGLGVFAATTVLPALRRRWLVEEQLFSVSLLVTGAAALLTAWFLSPLTVVAFAFVAGFGFNLGRQAFDSVLQRDAPDAVRGRYFARFETRFQLAWVIGALIPVALNLPLRLGMTFMGVTLGISLAACLAGISLENKLAGRIRSAVRRNRPSSGELPSGAQVDNPDDARAD